MINKRIYDIEEKKIDMLFSFFRNRRVDENTTQSMNNQLLFEHMNKHISKLITKQKNNNNKSNNKQINK